MDDQRITIDGVAVTPLKQINTVKGSIYHAMKKSDPSFHGFGEAYFSHVDSNQVKAWKIHSEMWLNLVVPLGSVKFVLYDQRENFETKGAFFEIILDPKTNYKRLTIPPGITFGFKGMDSDINLILNIASIEHRPDEVQNFDLESIDYNW